MLKAAWRVPPFIEVAAARLLSEPDFGADTPDAVNLVVKLCTDPRMEAVWKELLKKKRDGRFMYPAKSDALNFTNLRLSYLAERASELEQMEDDEHSRVELLSIFAEKELWIKEQKNVLKLIGRLTEQDRQEWACKEFFHCSYLAALHSNSIGVITEAEAASVAELYNSVADRLENQSVIAATLLGQEPHSEIRKIANALRRKSSFATKKVSAVRVKRRRSDDLLRGFTIRLHRHSVRIFGTHFYGLIAKIGNVAFDRKNITLVKVRELVR